MPSDRNFLLKGRLGGPFASIMSKQSTHFTNARTLAGIILNFQSGLKEPELVAASGLSERAVMLAVRAGVRADILRVKRCGEVIHGSAYAAERAEAAAYVARCDAMFDRLYQLPAGTSAAERANSRMALKPAVVR